MGSGRGSAWDGCGDGAGDGQGYGQGQVGDGDRDGGEDGDSAGTMTGWAQRWGQRDGDRTGTGTGTGKQGGDPTGTTLGPGRPPPPPSTRFGTKGRGFGQKPGGGGPSLALTRTMAQRKATSLSESRSAHRLCAKSKMEPTSSWQPGGSPGQRPPRGHVAPPPRPPGVPVPTQGPEELGARVLALEEHGPVVGVEGPAHAHQHHLHGAWGRGQGQGHRGVPSQGPALQFGGGGAPVAAALEDCPLPTGTLGDVTSPGDPGDCHLPKGTLGDATSQWVPWGCPLPPGTLGTAPSPAGSPWPLGALPTTP